MAALGKSIQLRIVQRSCGFLIKHKQCVRYFRPSMNLKEIHEGMEPLKPPPINMENPFQQLDDLAEKGFEPDPEFESMTEEQKNHFFEKTWAELKEEDPKTWSLPGGDVYVENHPSTPHNLYPLTTQGLQGLTDPHEIQALYDLDTEGYIKHYFGTCETTPTVEQIEHVKHDAAEDKYLQHGVMEEWGLNMLCVCFFAVTATQSFIGVGWPF